MISKTDREIVEDAKVVYSHVNSMAASRPKSLSEEDLKYINKALVLLNELIAIAEKSLGRCADCALSSVCAYLGELKYDSLGIARDSFDETKFGCIHHDKKKG